MKTLENCASLWAEAVRGGIEREREMEMEKREEKNILFSIKKNEIKKSMEKQDNDDVR